MWLKYWNAVMMPKLQRIVWEQERQKREDKEIPAWMRIQMEHDTAAGEATWGKPQVCD